METVFFESLRYKLITKKMIFITALVLIFILPETEEFLPRGSYFLALQSRKHQVGSAEQAFS